MIEVGIEKNSVWVNQGMDKMMMIATHPKTYRWAGDVYIDSGLKNRIIDFICGGYDVCAIEYGYDVAADFKIIMVVAKGETARSINEHHPDYPIEFEDGEVNSYNALLILCGLVTLEQVDAYGRLKPIPDDVLQSLMQGSVVA